MADGRILPARTSRHGASWWLPRPLQFGTLSLKRRAASGTAYLLLRAKGVRSGVRPPMGGTALWVRREVLDRQGKPLDWSRHRLGDLALVRLTLR